MGPGGATFVAERRGLLPILRHTRDRKKLGDEEPGTGTEETPNKAALADEVVSQPSNRQEEQNPPAPLITSQKL